jgi:hypothetical protein
VRSSSGAQLLLSGSAIATEPRLPRGTTEQASEERKRKDAVARRAHAEAPQGAGDDKSRVQNS